MKRRVVIFIAGWVFAAGIVLASLLPKESLSFGLYYFIAVLIFSVAAVWFWRQKKTRAVFIWAAILFLGIWRFAVSLPVDTHGQIFHYNGRKISFYGLVAAEPIVKGANQKIVVNTLAINNSSAKGQKRFVGVNGKVLVVGPAYPQNYFGDILEVTCKLETPGMIDDFDYGRYLAAQDIYSTCSFPKIYPAAEDIFPPPIVAEKRRESWLNWLWSRIYRVRNALSATIDNGLTEPEAGLLKAFLFNDPTVPDDLSLSFQQSGLSHIVAISGSHISELIGIVFFCLLFLGLNRRRAFWFCVPVIIFYVAMIGSPASALRAGIMGLLVLIAMYVGRLSRLDHSLVLSGSLMLMLNPMLAIADAGFQLSFLAVLGMIYLYPVFNRFLARYYDGKPAILKTAGEMTALTMAAQVFTAPILIFGFKQISLVAPLANLFALWVAPLIMSAAFIAMALAALIPAGAIYFFLPVDLLVKYLILVAELAARLPGAYLKW